MAKIRVLMFLVTCLVVGTFLYIGAMYARGYRYDINKKTLSPRGLLVLKSNPDGAQVYIDNIFKTATNSNISLVPGSYNVSIRKDGFRNWEKVLTIEKEIVTETDANLFRSVPALSPITYSGAKNPVQSDDLSKILFMVPATEDNLSQDKEGLYIIETINLPIGFSKDPRRITDGNLANTTYEFSPNGRQVLLKDGDKNYLLDDTTYTPNTKRIDITTSLEKTIKSWDTERKTRITSLLKNAPTILSDILSTSATSIAFSPDETKIMYKATIDADIPDELIKPIPGASTQKEERNIKAGRTYIYDIKEDRNFLISESEVKIDNLPIKTSTPSANLKKPVKNEAEKAIDTVRWYPTSKNVILSQSGKIIIMDIDGTNRQEIYSGSYVYPFAFPTANTDRIIILTNLGATTNPENLYTLILK